MRFKIKRTSNRYPKKNEPPIPEAQYRKFHFTNQLNGSRTKYNWAVDIETVEDLVNISKTHDCGIIITAYFDSPSIEIIDDWLS